MRTAKSVHKKMDKGNTEERRQLKRWLCQSFCTNRSVTSWGMQEKCDAVWKPVLGLCVHVI